MEKFPGSADPATILAHGRELLRVGSSLPVSLSPSTHNTSSYHIQSPRSTDQAIDYIGEKRQSERGKRERENERKRERSDEQRHDHRQSNDGVSERS